MTVQTLIDKQDTVEQVRDQIAGILATEVISQMALAAAASKDPNDWKLRVFSERANPWEQYSFNPTDKSPIVNVWFDSATYPSAGSGTVERQKTDARYNIDVYGCGGSSSDGAGHQAGDRVAALESQRGARLVRNILMASEYTYLSLRGLVWKRWPESMTSFQPQQDISSAQRIQATRIILGVTFNEFSPQYQGDALDFISIDIKKDTGEVIAEVDIDYT